VVRRTVLRERKMHERAIMHANNNNDNNTRHVRVRALGIKPARIAAARRAREADPLPRIHRSTIRLQDAQGSRARQGLLSPPCNRYLFTLISVRGPDEMTLTRQMDYRQPSITRNCRAITRPRLRTDGYRLTLARDTPISITRRLMSRPRAATC